MSDSKCTVSWCNGTGTHYIKFDRVTKRGQGSQSSGYVQTITMVTLVTIVMIKITINFKTKQLLLGEFMTPTGAVTNK